MHGNHLPPQCKHQQICVGQPFREMLTQVTWRFDVLHGPPLPFILKIAPCNYRKTYIRNVDLSQALVAAGAAASTSIPQPGATLVFGIAQRHSVMHLAQLKPELLLQAAQIQTPGQGLILDCQEQLLRLELYQLQDALAALTLQAVSKVRDQTARAPVKGALVMPHSSTVLCTEAPLLPLAARLPILRQLLILYWH